MLLDDISRLAAAQSSKGYEALDLVSQNMANYSTVGYKGQRFEQYLRADGTVDTVKRIDYKPGTSLRTERELDVAIDGPGFIQVTRPDGTTAYTRNGSFTKNADGLIVTNSGDLVGTGIQVPANYAQLQIKKDGTVQVYETTGATPKVVGKIPIVNFPNPEGLKQLDHSLVVNTETSGEPVQITDTQRVLQGHLEQSNVNMYFAVEDILRLNAQVISNVRIVKYIDDMYKQAIQLRQ